MSHAHPPPLLHRVTDDVAIAMGGDALSWRELDRRAAARADELRALGVDVGDRVACVRTNTLAHVVDLLAAWRMGAVWVPINPAGADAERAHIVSDCAPVVIVGDAGDTVRERSAQPAEGVALLVYTSGTTGKPKGCTHTHENVVDATRALMSAWRMSERDVLVHALPLFHVHGLCVALLGALMTGARVEMLAKFDVDAVVRSFTEGGTLFMGVPTMYRRILDALASDASRAGPLRAARLFTSGSAPLPASDFAEWQAKTGHEIVERYGMSETLITLSNPLPENGARKPGTVGKPLAGVSIRVVDDELQVRGPGVMRGYWNDPAATARTFTDDRWLKTGDAASVDDDGYVTIRGRLASDFVKVGGHKVSTRELEDALRSHPSIAEVAVVGVPDREWGERIVACVALRAGAAVTLEELQRHSALSGHKLPRGLLVVDALPRNAMGKVQKHALAALARERA